MWLLSRQMNGTRTCIYYVAIEVFLKPTERDTLKPVPLLIPVISHEKSERPFEYRRPANRVASTLRSARKLPRNCGFREVISNVMFTGDRCRWEK